MLSKDEYEKLESVRQKPAVGEPPLPPLYYDERYELPAHRIKLLQRLYNYKRDEEIVFYEEPHVYLVQNVPSGASVSGLLKKFEDDLKKSGLLKSKKLGSGYISSVKCEDALNFGLKKIIKSSSYFLNNPPSFRLNKYPLK